MDYSHPHQNLALWTSSRGRHHVDLAPYPTPGPGQVVVRQHATSINPVDTMAGPAYRFVCPWLRYPAILGSDVAGEVTAVGDDVTRFHPGDRVVGHALALEKDVNDPAQGAFQRFVVLQEHMVAPLPDAIRFEDAAALPLTLSTAATALFQHDHLALHLPTAAAAGQVDRGQAVVVWGGSTSVGLNAIQLARNAGYRVLATSSPRNADLLRSLGADAVDRTSSTAVADLLRLVGNQPVAGVLAIGNGSMRPCMAVAARTRGAHRVASAMPRPVARAQSVGASRLGVKVSGIWGGSLKDNPVGETIWTDYLPAALADGRHRCEPPVTVVGDGLQAIPDAMARLREGVSASKLVVTI